jgi:predicted RNA-binding protein YlqC (UPF0109 family)
VTEGDDLAYDDVDDDLEDDDDLDDDLDDDDHNRIPAATAKAVLTHCVREIVDDADAVRVEVDDSSDRIVLNVYVGPGDLGRVIGKRGRIARDIRRVTRAAAIKDGVEVDIEFVE